MARSAALSWAQRVVHIQGYLSLCTQGESESYLRMASASSAPWSSRWRSRLFPLWPRWWCLSIICQVVFYQYLFIQLRLSGRLRGSCGVSVELLCWRWAWTWIDLGLYWTRHLPYLRLFSPATWSCLALPALASFSKPVTWPHHSRGLPSNSICYNSRYHLAR